MNISQHCFVPTGIVIAPSSSGRSRAYFSYYVNLGFSVTAFPTLSSGAYNTPSSSAVNTQYPTAVPYQIYYPSGDIVFTICLY